MRDAVGKSDIDCRSFGLMAAATNPFARVQTIYVRHLSIRLSAIRSMPRCKVRRFSSMN